MDLPADTILSVQNLEKTFDNGVRALKNISFDVKRGEFLVVIGLSGSGKSTLLRCLNRMHDPTAGKIFFQNENVTDWQGPQVRELRRKIAMIFQHFNLVTRHTVLNNVLMGSLAIMPTWKSLLGLFPESLQKKAMGYLQLVGIQEKARIRAGQLSGGQQQRVAIARALMQEPQLLLADEPVASLDPATCHVVMDYLEKVNRELGVTVICNLHFLSLVRRYATRVIALKAGEIVFQGSPADIDEEWFRRIYGESAKEVHVN
ncbi:MAG: phosphonate ABC transporter ATP-binding protein [Bdellovibrio sp. CG10_big_fil_rev_8_21_14_0_10_47_8]|nr:MAG: phosphonate ABC transporter ATP-binding protein [Bdellovibrio sp. CG10_big_fil_rev_8_21_14_0_10_47_8]